MQKIAKDLSVRTPAEELWIARKAAGLTQAEGARRAGLGRNAYAEAELGRKPVPGAAAARIRSIPSPCLAALLALARRRSGIGLETLARRLRISRVTVHAWEKAGDLGLVVFWEKRGFRFPGRKL